MNRLLGSGSEQNGRPLLGGIGSPYDSSSARAGTGLGYGSISEAFARTQQYVRSILFPSSNILSDYVGSQDPTDVENIRDRLVD